jgi:hypothetical protein
MSKQIKDAMNLNVDVLALGQRGLPMWPFATIRETTASHDYQVVLWQPNDLGSDKVRDRTADGTPKVPYAEGVALRKSFAARRADLKAFVDTGGILAIFVSPEITYGFVDSRGYIESHETGWTPFPYQNRPSFTPSRGTKFGSVDEHPLGEFLSSRAAFFQFEATLKWGIPSGWRSIAETVRTKESVGAEFRVKDGGKVLLLPALNSNYLATLSEEEQEEFLQSLVSAMIDVPHENEDPPEWLAEYQSELERAAREALDNAEVNLRKAKEDRDEKALAVLRAAGGKSLLYATGAELEEASAEVFSLLGGERVSPAPGRLDLEFDFQIGKLIVEVKGVKGSASEKNAAQLEKWASDYVIAGQMVKPALLVNGFRDKSPRERKSPVFPDQMLEFSSRRGHLLLTTTQLYVIRCEIEKNPARNAEIVEQLFSTVGPLKAFGIDLISGQQPR